MSETDAPDWLLGRWRLQRAEPGLDILPGTGMDFRAGGALIYTIEIAGRQAVFELTYQIAGSLLRTVHSSGGHIATSRFELGRDGLLQFDFGGKRAWFVRDGLM
jgi:hypothetical protein